LGCGWQRAFDPYGDVGYAATASQNIKTVGHAQDYHDYQAGSGAQNYGYDAQGNLITSGANYNPYSQAMVLQRNYDNTKRGTINNYASQGQLYSGALLNKQGDDAYNYNVADDRLKRSANDYYHANDYSLTQTKDNADAILAQLLGPTFQNFLNSQKGYRWQPQQAHGRPAHPPGQYEPVLWQRVARSSPLPRVARKSPSRPTPA
jgi:hypothetical protein